MTKLNRRQARASRSQLIQERLGAEEGTRTPTPLRVRGPEPRASANSATSARDTNLTLCVRPAASLSLAKRAGHVKSWLALKMKVRDGPEALDSLRNSRLAFVDSLQIKKRSFSFRFRASNLSSVRGQSEPSSRDRLRSASTLPPVGHFGQ